MMGLVEQKKSRVQNENNLLYVVYKDIAWHDSLLLGWWKLMSEKTITLVYGIQTNVRNDIRLTRRQYYGLKRL